MGICSFISSSCISELCVHNTLQILINSVWGASILSLPSVSSELFYCIPNCIFHRSQSLNWLSILNCYLLLLFSCLVAPDSLWSHGLQQASLPCPLPSPRACSNSCPLSRWCHLVLCHPLLLLPSVFPSTGVFSNESALHIRWPTYWSFSFSISFSNAYSGLISFRMDWFDLLAVQEALKSLLQHHSVKVSILQSSAFFMVQLSHAYMATWKIIDLTRRNFVSKVMS